MPDAVRWRAQRHFCEICTRTYGRIYIVRRRPLLAVEHIDHIFPRRWLTRRGLNPHRIPNLVSVCQICHGKKKKAEDALFRGDNLGFLQGLIGARWPVELMCKASRAYGLGFGLLARRLASGFSH